MSDSKTVKKKSLEINMILNAIKGIMRIIFPLITFPYVSKVLGVEGGGKIQFCEFYGWIFYNVCWIGN